jgi:hypothetical protein
MEETARRYRELHTGFWLVNLREIDHLEDLGIDGRIINLKQKG